MKPENKDTDKGQKAAVALVTLVGIGLFVWDLVAYFGSYSYLAYGLSYILEWSNGRWEWLADVLWRGTYYPPFYDVWTKIAVLLVGFDLQRMLYVDTAFVVLAAIYLAFLCHRLGMGLFSFVPPLLVLFFPGIFAVSRVLAIESPLVLFVPAFVFHLIASDGFRNTGHSLFVGLFAGLGMLTKWSYAGFIIGPVLALAPMIFLVSFTKDETSQKALRERLQAPSFSQYRNIILALVVCIGLAGWWYVLRMDWQTFYLSSKNTPDGMEYSFLSALDKYWRIFQELVCRGWFWWMVALCGAGLVLSKKPFRILAAGFLGVLLPMIVLSLPVHGEARYLYPLLPAVAVVLGMSAAYSRWLWAKWALSAGLIAIILVSHFGYLKESPNFLKSYYNIGFPSEADRLLGFIEKSTTLQEGQLLEVGIHPAWRNFHMDCNYLKYFAETRGETCPMRVRCIQPAFNYGYFRDRLRAGEYDAVLLDCGPDGDCWKVNKKALESALQWMEKDGNINQMTGEYAPVFTREDLEYDLELLRRDFREALIFPLEDGTQTTIYLRKSDLRNEP